MKNFESSYAKKCSSIGSYKGNPGEEYASGTPDIFIPDYSEQIRGYSQSQNNYKL